MAVAARPPYSSGQWTAAQRPSLQEPLPGLAGAVASFSPATWLLVGDLLAGQERRRGARRASARSSSRKASSSGARAKSTGREDSRASSTLTPGSGNSAATRWVPTRRGDSGLHVRCGAAGPPRRGPTGAWARSDGDAVRALADDPAGITPELWEPVGRPRLDRHARAARRRVPACSRRASCWSRWAGSRCPARSSRRAMYGHPGGAGPRRRGTAGGARRGGRRGTVALHERVTAIRWTPCAARARRKGSGWVVSGHKPIVVDGHTADWAIVVALGEEGVRSFLLEPPRPQTEAVPTLDPDTQAGPSGPRRASRSSPSVLRATSPACGGGCSTTWRSALAAELVGVADGRSTRPSSTPRQRVVFDRPIATFQSVKHRIVDMYHALEMARVGVHFAAWAVRHRCAGPGAGGRDGRQLRRGGGGAGDRRQHPGPRRASGSRGRTTPTSSSSGPSRTRCSWGAAATSGTRWRPN